MSTQLSLGFIAIFPIFAVLVLAFLGVIFFGLIRAVFSGPALRAPPPPATPVMGGIGIQLGPDGFWIFSVPHDPGSLIHYHYWTGGVRHGGRVPYQPGADGRQFIYTGNRPDQAAIVQVDEVDDGGTLFVPPVIVVDGGGAMDVPPPSFTPPFPPPPVFDPPSPPAPPSFPSAY